MIRALVDFALNNKFVVLAIGVLLVGWGAVSFHNLPVEAYPVFCVPSRFSACRS